MSLLFNGLKLDFGWLMGYPNHLLAHPERVRMCKKPTVMCIGDVDLSLCMIEVASCIVNDGSTEQANWHFDS